MVVTRSLGSVSQTSSQTAQIRRNAAWFGSVRLDHWCSGPMALNRMVFCDLSWPEEGPSQSDLPSDPGDLGSWTAP